MEIPALRCHFHGNRNVCRLASKSSWVGYRRFSSWQWLQVCYSLQLSICLERTLKWEELLVYLFYHASSNVFSASLLCECCCFLLHVSFSSHFKSGKNAETGKKCLCQDSIVCFLRLLELSYYLVVPIERRNIFVHCTICITYLRFSEGWKESDIPKSLELRLIFAREWLIRVLWYENCPAGSLI